MVISKSEYMLFLKHPAWLWLKKYDKSKIPETDANLQALFDDGNLFEDYAEKLFPNAVELGYKTNGNFDGSKYNSLPELTKKEIEKGTEVLFQGRFEIDSLTSIFDVLERVSKNTFNLYEIKSSSSVKPEHIQDLAFQTVVLEKAGLSINKIYVLHVNDKYIRKGAVDPAQISKRDDVTEKVRVIMNETIANIDEALRIIAMKESPDISPRYLKQGSMEEWLEIFKLAKGKILEHSIYDLAGITTKQIGLLEDKGIKYISEIPLDFELSDRQLSQVEAVKRGQQVKKEEIMTFIGKFEYPLYFFDYETFSSVIPAFDGLRPHQQVPFQYSLHILETPDSKPVHKEFLHTENSDPTLLLVKKMRDDLGGKGSILVWYESFEKTRNKELAKMYPEYEPFLLGLNDRIIDLMVPFAKGWFTNKDFFGSASLKAVSPVLIKDKDHSYSELEIHDGGTAQRIWMETVLKGKNKEKKDEIMNNLRKYCGLDTEIMIKILEEIKKNIK